MKKDKTNIVNTLISSKAKILQAEDREYIDTDYYVWDADPHNLSVKDFKRVSRGGGWYGYARYSRVSFPSNFTPSHRNKILGFRVVLQTRSK
jgi:formylglycine-generating enzyme required for sulfatase activity